MVSVFGPIILVYVSGVLRGTVGSAADHQPNPYVLHAFNPVYGMRFFVNNGVQGFWALGSVFLAVTGCEALYADMGHFGRKPIRVAWSRIVLWALIINYLGQGALLISQPESINNPFFMLAPSWYTLSGCWYCHAGVGRRVASLDNRCLLSYASGDSPRLFVLAWIFATPQAMRWLTNLCAVRELGVDAWPRFWLVASFETSTNLAGAYGIAVSLTMLITSLSGCDRRLESLVHWRLMGRCSDGRGHDGDRFRFSRCRKHSKKNPQWWMVSHWRLQR